MKYQQGLVVTCQWDPGHEKRDPNLPDFTQLTLSNSEYKALPIEKEYWAPNPLALSCLTSGAQRAAIQCRTQLQILSHIESILL